MSEPFIGEIRMFAGNFAPVGWALCEGQLVAINQNTALFSLIGTTYGGDGQTTFALPDLRGRLPVHQGSPFVIGETGGAETVTLSVSQIPAHAHPVNADPGYGDRSSPAGAVPGRGSGLSLYAAAAASGQIHASGGQTGGGQPHSNLSPYLCVNFIISLFGVFPSQN